MVFSGGDVGGGIFAGGTVDYRWMVIGVKC